MTGTTTNFQGLPLNIDISIPQMGSAGAGCGSTPATSDCGCSGSTSVVATGPGCPTCKSQPGNGIAPIFNGQNPIPMVASAPIAAFLAVRQGIGGMSVIDIDNIDDRDLILGISLAACAGGQVGCVAWAGPVVNTINGTGGWNFVVNEPVYIGLGGVITQTPPTTAEGWALPIGFALSSNSIYLFATRQLAGGGGTPTPTAPVVRVIPWASTLDIDSQSADVFDLTLSGATDFRWTNGVDGRLVTLRITSDSYYDELNFFGNNVQQGDAFLSPYYGDGSKGIYTFMYNEADNDFVVVSSNRYSMAV